MALTPEQTVDAFIAAIERRDVDAACALADEEISYENVPMQPIKGRTMLHAVLGSFVGKSTQVDWRIIRQVAAGDVVVNERLDRFEMDGKWVEIPVAGIFEVRDGLITLWRDYFDLATFTNQMPK